MSRGLSATVSSWPLDPPSTSSSTREVLVREALALLDAEGLDALTMRSLADRLGVVPNALYRHVKDKDDLLDGVMDATVASVPIPDPDLDWTRWPHGACSQHPIDDARPPGRSPASSSTDPTSGWRPSASANTPSVCCSAAGFKPADADRALNVVLVWTLGFVALEVPRMGEPHVTKAELDKAYEFLPADVLPTHGRGPAQPDRDRERGAVLVRPRPRHRRPRPPRLLTGSTPGGRTTSSTVRLFADAPGAVAGCCAVRIVPRGIRRKSAFHDRAPRVPGPTSVPSPRWLSRVRQPGGGPRSPGADQEV